MYTLYTQTLNTPLGKMIAIADKDALVSLKFFDENRETPKVNGIHKESALLSSIKKELAAYFSGNLKIFNTPIALSGSALQNAVWKELAAIPCGKTTSYSALAAAIQKPKATRSVATAIGKNPLAIIIPCHRVIRKNGTMGGYSAGLSRKKKLLTLEAKHSIVNV